MTTQKPFPWIGEHPNLHKPKTLRELGKPLDAMVIAYEKRIEEQEQRIAELERNVAAYQRLYKERGLRIAKLEQQLHIGVATAPSPRDQ